MHCSAEHFAPANIALIKYWGKRDAALNLPLNSSLSLSLNQWGSRSRISEAEADAFYFHGEALPAHHPMRRKAFAFIDALLPLRPFLRIDSENSVPTAAGLASSASGFAALVLALNDFFAWNKSRRELSLLARRGSGSACRSLWHGFVKWHRGTRDDGEDSHGEPLEALRWDELRWGLLEINTQPKSVSSREGMLHTVRSSPLHRVWAETAEADLIQLEEALRVRDFEALGSIAEGNALAMHATMLAARPALCYWQPESLAQWQKLWQLRAEGLSVYGSMDAGANLKLLFLQENQASLEALFPGLKTVAPWAGLSQ